METTIINTGDEVICDFCNGGEDTMGGLLIGSYAVCGDCAKTVTHTDEISEVFDPTKTFKQNVLDYRLRTYGTSDCITEITTWEDDRCCPICDRDMEWDDSCKMWYCPEEGNHENM